MTQDRFFQTTRGKIVATLRRRGAASAVDLAAEFGLSANAIRQHLVLLERDGVVAEHPVRRGKTKPTIEYSLTGEAERLFPQQYDRMLNAVLREVRETGGAVAVAALFEGMGKRSAVRFGKRLEGLDRRGKVAELASILRERGVDAEVEEGRDGTLSLVERHCPYAHTVAENPEICGVIRTVLDKSGIGAYDHVESLATGGHACRFTMRPAQ
jgi:predicted ArsR family transcriptional regulator